MENKNEVVNIMQLEKMDEFFNKRADIYDDHMLIDLQLAEFYESILQCFSDIRANPSLLDLGCGTGLELERLFQRMPDMQVTGIDLSFEMLKILRQKYPDKKLNLICTSYFDIDFGTDCYDYALSTYSLHHFSESKKAELYKKIYDSLRSDGLFVEGDYTCKTMEQQLAFIRENEIVRSENGKADGFYHYDMPFTAETQIRLIKEAGFRNVTLYKQWENTSIIKATK